MNEAIEVGILSGLIGALIGSVGTIYIGNKQIRATTVSANRQQWITSLRDEIASFLSHLNVIGYIASGSLTYDAGAFRSAVEGLHLSEAKIQLMINPKEADHEKLIKLLEAAITAAVKKKDKQEAPTKDEKKEDPVGDVVRQAQKILKREWVRVKSGA